MTMSMLWETKTFTIKKRLPRNFLLLPDCKCFFFQVSSFLSLQHNNKLQVLFLRADNLRDDDVKQICHVLKPDAASPSAAPKPLKVLDLSYNPLTKDSVGHIADMLETNRTLEYVGLAKCNLQASQV